MIVVASTRRRPKRSPIGPSTSPPTGRSTNETANTSRVFSVAAASLPVGKKAFAMYVAAYA